MSARRKKKSHKACTHQHMCRPLLITCLRSPMSGDSQLNPPLQPAPSSQMVKPISHPTAQVAWSDTLHPMLSPGIHVWKCIHQGGGATCVWSTCHWGQGLIYQVSKPQTNHKGREKEQTESQTRITRTNHSTNQMIGPEHLGNFTKSTIHTSHMTGGITDDFCLWTYHRSQNQQHGNQSDSNPRPQHRKQGEFHQVYDL